MNLNNKDLILPEVSTKAGKNGLDLNVWKSVKTTEFPKEKKFDLLDARGIIITTDLKGNRKVTFKKPEPPKPEEVIEIEENP